MPPLVARPLLSGIQYAHDDIGACAGTPHADIMKRLARQWHDDKEKGGKSNPAKPERMPMRQLDLSDLSLS